MRLVESSEEGYCSKRAVLPMMMVMLSNLCKLAVIKLYVNCIYVCIGHSM
jgi:hypothetical protein